MYVCPLCGMKYQAEVPANCQQCKRPLVLRGRFRIEIGIQEGPGGEDFDALDLKTKENVILRELRIKKSEASARQREIDRYAQNRDRLRKMKFEGKPVVIDAFEEETANSRCLYMVFDSDAWGALGDELDAPGGGGGAAAASAEPLEELAGREMDPELEAMLAKLNKERGGPPKVSNKDLGELGDLEVGGGGGGGAMVKAGGKDTPPAKKPAGGGAMSPKTKAVIGVSLLAIIGAIVAALVLL